MEHQLIPFTVVLLAGGMGTRMKNLIPKQYLTIQEKPIALHSFEKLASMPEIEQMIVVCEPQYEQLFTVYKLNKPLIFARPGLRRQDSLWNGIKLIAGNPLVCIHDSARPFIEIDRIRQTVVEAEKWGAAVLGVRVKATIKICEEKQFIVNTPNRAFLWEMQTPQIVRLKLLYDGFSVAQKNELTVSDDVSLVELIDKPVKVVEGSYLNIKITTPEDLLIAQSILKNHALL
ncbi:2-C-methyl-D-erythritol 4-phosphate cytidylyltransferase [Candidatus Protochlamydia sp. W-9]|uniref:2-C-methyl-D-erythritol 4-phosphate cytidylyltransferase n=1 Tax=Candidatus Protochlamydia sp. W-9 TaxID=1785087 RepID=UPI00096A602B|nr:2-C-methyl-D-erythritol 4-phosphate cytidylyltransferase [Candidatus Protochlamydia sp. W-9]